MRRHLIGWISVLILAAGCCPITSVHPLNPVPDATYDQRLTGIWQLNSKEDRVFLHLGRAVDGGWQVVLVEHKPNGALEQEAFSITTSAIGRHHYLTLDLRKVSQPVREGQEGHIILKYALPDNYTLNIQRMNLEVVAAAIQGQWLAGEIQYDQTAIEAKGATHGDNRKIDCARITDTSSGLANFIAGDRSDPLFLPYLTFKRVPCVPLR